MKRTNYEVWENLFPKRERLLTNVKKRPFQLVCVSKEGIELKVPGKRKNRKLVLTFDRLDALWEAKDQVNNSKGRLPDKTTNKIWRSCDINTDSTNEAQYWAVIRARQDKEKLRDPRAAQSPYDPRHGDERDVVRRQIHERRGQPQFRNALINRYGKQCVVTGCKVPEVLEAAHIKEYRGEYDNDPGNGLLLRADIHTLFDQDLLGIEPHRLEVKLHPSLLKEYSSLIGRELRIQPARSPSLKALKYRYRSFRQRLIRKNRIN